MNDELTITYFGPSGGTPSRMRRKGKQGSEDLRSPG